MSLGPAGLSLNPEQTENFEDVRGSYPQSSYILIQTQMEKQFAVKGSPPEVMATFTLPTVFIEMLQSTDKSAS